MGEVSRLVSEGGRVARRLCDRISGELLPHGRGFHRPDRSFFLRGSGDNHLYAFMAEAKHHNRRGVVQGGMNSASNCTMCRSTRRRILKAIATVHSMRE